MRIFDVLFATFFLARAAGSSSSTSSLRNVVSEPSLSASRDAASTDLVSTSGQQHLTLSVAFHSLLYHLCSFYEGEATRRQLLFEGK